jgi:putative ABC transport system permease protein
MLRLLLTVGWPTYRATPGRLMLVLSGLALGVSLIAAIGIINASVLANFRASLEQSAGKAALQIHLGTGEVGFPDTIADDVTHDSAVLHAIGMVRGTLHASDGSGEVLQLFGVDFLSGAVDAYDVAVASGENPLELLNDQRSILLTDEYAHRRGLHVGDVVRFATPSGIADLRLRGLLTASGLATMFGGNLAVMDLPAAQRLLSKPDRIDQVDLILKPEVSVPEVQRRIAAALPASLSVTRPALRGERFERVVAAFQALLDGISALCMLASIFIVSNTMATAITERAQALAVLRTLGASRRRIARLVLLEAAICGAVASVVGIALGAGLASLLTAFVTQSMGVIYQLRLPSGGLAVSGLQFGFYLLLGIGGAVAAAWIPARKAGQLDPIALLRHDYREQLVGRSADLACALAGVLVVLASTGAIWMERRSQSAAWGNIAASLWWIAGILFAIPAMSLAARVLERLLPRLLGVAGQVAGAGLRRAPARTGVTVAVIGLSLTLAVVLSTLALSFRESERNWFILSGDLLVSSVGTEGGWLESPLAAEVGDQLAQLPGVGHVETYRALQGQPFRDTRIAVAAVSSAFVDTPEFRHAVVAGDADGAIQAIATGREVLVSDNLADRLGLSVGDDIAVPTPAGPATFRIRAVLTADYTGDQGSIILQRDRFVELWGDDRVSHFNVFLRPGADLEAVRAAIVRALDGHYVVKVLTVGQALAYHQHMVDRAFAFTYAIQLLVIVVTLAGIVDLLTTQIIERRRETGLLRLIGAPRRVISQSIWLEALVLGLAGAALGILVSVADSVLWVRINFPLLVGYIIEHHFAALTAVWCALLAAGVATLAGWLAGRRALREPVLDTLRFE